MTANQNESKLRASCLKQGKTPVTFVLAFESDWMRGWRNFVFGPSIERDEANPKNSRKRNFYSNILLTVRWPVRCTHADGAVFQFHIKRTNVREHCFDVDGHASIITYRTLQDFWFNA